MAQKIASGSKDYVNDWLTINKSVGQSVGGLHAVGIDNLGYHRIDQKSGTILTPQRMTGLPKPAVAPPPSA
jgi:hypothetical protein